MKRRLLIAAIFLLAGAVVNVAVAWGCALAVINTNPQPPVVYSIDGAVRSWHPPLGRRLDNNEVEAFWKKKAPAAWGIAKDREGNETWMIGLTHRSCIGSFITMRAKPSSDDYKLAMSFVQVAELRAGIPVRSLKWDLANSNGGLSFTGGLSIGGKIPYSERLPLIPVWPGFAVNTVVYAAVLWLMIPGPFVLCRVIRVRGGLCPACAYPRGEAEVCSECGKALPERAREVT